MVAWPESRVEKCWLNINVVSFTQTIKSRRSLISLWITKNSNDFFRNKLHFSLCSMPFRFHWQAFDRISHGGTTMMMMFFSRGVAVHFPTQIRIERQPFAIQCSTLNSHSNKCISKQESFFQIVDLISVSRFRIIKGLIILIGVKYEIWPFYVPLSITITEQ